MNALWRLSYADRRAFFNALRMLRRRPWRAAMWTGYAVALVGFAYLRLATGSRHGRGDATMRAAFSPVTSIDDLLVCGFAIALGLLLMTGTARWLGVFSSRAEALLLARATAPPVLTAAYLQVRAVTGVIAQAALRFAYLVIVVLPPGTTPLALARELLFFVAMTVAIASVVLPRALARGAVRVAAIAAGAAITAVALVPLAADALRLLRLRGDAGAGVLSPAAALHPGLLMYAIARGDLRAIALPLAVAAAATAAFVLAARDAYPELYAISLAALEFRAHRRGRRFGRAAAETGEAGRPRRGAVVARSGGTRLRGALVFVWSDALAFSRRVSPVTTGVVAAIALAAGALLGGIARTDNGSLALMVLAGMLPGVYIALASTAAVRLAPVLRMPLFWLGDVPLVARLGAWSASSLWRDGGLVALAAAGYAAVAHDARVPALAVCGALGLLALTRGVGLAVFALLPNTLDQRGPAVMIRALLATALGLPAIVAGAIAALVLGRSPVVVGIGAATVTALGEAVLLIAFAAYRLAGRVDRLSHA